MIVRITLYELSMDVLGFQVLRRKVVTVEALDVPTGYFHGFTVDYSYVCRNRLM